MNRLIAACSWLMMPRGGLALGEELTAATAGPMPLVSETLLHMVVGTGLVLVLIGVSAWLLRRYATLRGNGGLVNICGGLALGSRERIVLIEVRGKHLLLGVTPGRVQTLHVFDSATSGSRFASELVLAGARGSGEREEGADTGSDRPRSEQRLP